MNRTAWIDSLAQDVRFAWRGMRHAPAFTIVAVITLALGIGVNTTVFTVTNAALFKGFRSIHRNDRILYIGTQNHGRGCCVSYPDFADWRAQARSFEGLGAVADLRITLSDSIGIPESYSATKISANGFQLLGQRPMLGRDFAAADETPGAAAVAILSHGFWQRRYGSDPAIIGRSVRINGASTIVIGVMASGFAFPQNQDLWVPLVPTPDLQQRDARGLWFAFGRIADGETRESARAELETIGRRLADDYPRTNQGWLPQPLNFTEFFVGRNATMIYGAMWGAVGFVLLIACANLANLLLARAIGRSREISVRIALGAGRWRIIRQLLVESLLLSALGGLLGWWIAGWSVRGYELVANPPTLSWSDHLLDYRMDYRVFAYLMAISVGTGLLFGLAPALRLSKFDALTALKDGGARASGGGRARRLSTLLVMGEMALAVVLLAGAGVMIRSFLHLYTADLGVDTANTLTMLVNLPDDRYPRADTQMSFHQRLEARVGAIPGVESTAIASALPTGGTRQVPYEIADVPTVDTRSRPTLSALTIGPAYFRTLRAALLAGREFTEVDGGSTAPAVIVNERFASRHWPGQDPLGKRLRLFDGRTAATWLTVVGVAANIVQDDPGRQEFHAVVYVPYRQTPARSMWVIVRTRVPPGGLASVVRHEIQALDPDLPIWIGPFTLTERLAGSGAYWRTANDAVLFLIFAAIGLLLASIGLYAVVAHAVTLRTQEIGIRIAIGATARDILTLVFKQGMVPLGMGLMIGLALSLAVNRVLRAELVRVSPADPLVLAIASATLIVSAMLGCWLPARRAVRMDPVVALRHD
jgi:putative ABC transport system permease protein